MRRLLHRAFALALVSACVHAARPANASEWGFAAEAGAVTAAAAGTPFVLRLTPYRALAPEFSLGPTVYLSPAGDAQMFGGALLAQFHAEMGELRVVPFLGLGVAHRRSDDDNDTAFWFPLGGSIDLPIDDKLFLRGTASVNIHGLELEGDKDDASLGLTAGIHYQP